MSSSSGSNGNSGRKPYTTWAPPKLDSFAAAQELSRTKAKERWEASNAANKAGNTEEGGRNAAFATGYEVEADVTSRISSFGPPGFTHVASQVQFRGALPSQAIVNGYRIAYREADHIVESASEQLHMNEIKTAKITDSALDQLIDLSMATTYNDRNLHSLTVLFGAGSQNAELDKLDLVHRYSQTHGGVPVLVRTNSMRSLPGALTVPDALKWRAGRYPGSPHAGMAARTSPQVEKNTGYDRLEKHVKEISDAEFARKYHAERGFQATSTAANMNTGAQRPTAATKPGHAPPVQHPHAPLYYAAASGLPPPGNAQAHNRVEKPSAAGTEERRDHHAQLAQFAAEGQARMAAYQDAVRNIHTPLPPLDVARPLSSHNPQSFSSNAVTSTGSTSRFLPSDQLVSHTHSTTMSSHVLSTPASSSFSSPQMRSTSAIDLTLSPESRIAASSPGPHAPKRTNSPTNPNKRKHVADDAERNDTETRTSSSSSSSTFAPTHSPQQRTKFTANRSPVNNRVQSSSSSSGAAPRFPPQISPMRSTNQTTSSTSGFDATPNATARMGPSSQMRSTTATTPPSHDLSNSVPSKKPRQDNYNIALPPPSVTAPHASPHTPFERFTPTGSNHSPGLASFFPNWKSPTQSTANQSVRNVGGRGSETKPK